MIPTAETTETIRIGVISDTHMTSAETDLFALRKGPFQDVSMILHAGDLVRYRVLDAFYDLDVIGVAGNCDGKDVRARFPDTRVVTAGSCRIGLVHGWGHRESVMHRAREAFTDVDAVVFGHTHVPFCEFLDGVLMFNPGSFSHNRGGSVARSVGILTIAPNDGISGAIIAV